MKITLTKIILFVIIVSFSVNFAYAQTAIRIGSGTAISPVSTGTQTTAYPSSPINISYGHLRSQIIYLASEITALGITGSDKELVKFGFYIESPPDVPLPNFKIRMANTQISTLGTTGQFASTDPTPSTEVYSNSSYMPKAGGFDTLTLTEPFTWDGASNILVDICFDPVSAVSPTGTLRVYGTTKTYAAVTVRSNNSGDQCLTSLFAGISKPQCVMVFCCYTRDVELYSIDNPAKPFPQGEQDVLVRIRNFGSVRLDSVMINWKLNNVAQPAFKWKGQLNPEAISEPIAIGKYNFVQGEKYSVEASTSLPNAGADQNTVNDLKSVSDLYPGISGIFTIGGLNPDFTSVADAVTLIKKVGITGPVTFNLRDSLTYQEQIVINEIAGASETNRVVFQSESGNRDSVLIYCSPTSAAPYIFLLDGADYITFRNLTFRTYQDGSNPSTVFLIQNKATHNLFENNRIISFINTGGSGDVIKLKIEGVASDHNVFRNNDIINGTTGIVFEGLSGLYVKGTRIEGNKFEGQRDHSISLFYQDGPVVTGNNIFNKGTSADFGIYVRNSRGTVNRGLIANNFIMSDPSSGGIGIENTTALDVYNNTVSVTGSGAQVAINIFSNSRSITLKNNIFSNRAGGRAILFNADSATFVSDNNNYYILGTTLGQWRGNDQASLANWKTASSQDAQSFVADPDFISLEDLHTFSPNLNGKGVPLPEVTQDIDKQPRNPTTPDIGADEFTIGKDGGVLEMLSPLPTDIIVINTPQTIRIRLSNFGNDTLVNFPVKYTVDGGPAVEEIFADTLSPGATKEYTFDSLWTPSATGAYLICVSINIAGEQNPDNDQLCLSVNAQDVKIDAGIIEISSPPLEAVVGGSYPVTVKVKNFGDISLTNFMIKVLKDGGPFIDHIYTGTLAAGSVEDVTFTKNFEPDANGLYVFKVYTVVDNDATVDNDTAVHSVTVGTIGLSSEPATQLKVYPNPSTGQVTLRFTLLHTAPVKVTCVNFLGQAVLAEEIGAMPSGQNNYVLDTTHLPAGAYMVLLDTGKRIEKALLIRQNN